MSADTCPRCGRESGWGLTQCSPRDHESCLGFLRDRAERERDEARAHLADALEERAKMARDLADAKAEVERLRAIAVGAGTVARIVADEADELRRLAWEWCIEAREWHMRHFLARRGLRVALKTIDDMVAQTQARPREYEWDDERECEAGGHPYVDGPLEPRSAFDDMAERAGPLPTAVLAQTEPPIESLGPVPLTAGDLAVMSMNDTIGVRTVLRWLVRDAVRRGAELEGE